MSEHPANCGWHLDQSMYDCTCGFYKPCIACWFGQKLINGDWTWCDECRGTRICKTARAHLADLPAPPIPEPTAEESEK